MARKASPQSRRPSMLDDSLRACRYVFGVVGLFSLIANMLILAQPLYMLQVYDRVLTTGRTETLTMLTILAVGALLMLGALDALRSSIMIRLGAWLNLHLAPVLLTSSVRARLQGDEAGAQPLRDLSVLQSFLAGSGLTFLFDAPLVPLFVLLVWMLHPELGVLALVAAAALFGLSLLNDLMTRKPLLDANLKQIGSNLQAEAMIRNAEVVRAMGMVPAMIERWQKVYGQALETGQSASVRTGSILGMTKAIRGIVQVAVLGWGALLVLRGELTPGGMIASSVLLSRALAPVEQAVTGWKTFVAARIAYERLGQRLQSLPPEPERMQLPAPAGHLSFERVNYVVPGGRAILRQLSFEVAPGEVLAVIGPSAAGKSTLCRLLVGLLQPTSGQVRFDGADLAHWDPRQLGPFIGYLPQDVELFAGTVGDNIARMTQGTDEEIVRAAQLSHAHEMILSLPNGYDTEIGDAGLRLSGGQRQRIGLARAVYGDPRLIILDEPNANLDQRGEAALAGAIEDLKKRGAAVVIVGHRPSTLAQADKILLLKEGRIELMGPRDTVMQRLRKKAVKSTDDADDEADRGDEQRDAPDALAVSPGGETAPAKGPASAPPPSAPIEAMTRSGGQSTAAAMQE
jgi:PrtD family type I secretion system ABC transporter